MPNALSIGVSYELFWHLTPKKLKTFEKAYRIKKRLKDEEMYMQGYYNMIAFEVALSNFGACMFGGKPEAKYLDEPILFKEQREEKMTQEEKDNLEIQKMIFAEEMWIRNDKLRGLPETMIK